MERSLTSVFEKHLGFPGAGRARVTAEAFVDRVVDKLHRFDEASDDLVRWVEHFFETEHLAEDRRVEFAAFAEGREHPVLEVSLGEQEFVVVDSDRDDEIVVVSGAGSMVVQRSAELVSRLRAAELPASQQHRPGDAFRPSGERVYLVNGQGTVTALDAKAVMAAIRAAPARAEPVARVTDAATRLPFFSPASTSSVARAGSVVSTGRSMSGPAIVSSTSSPTPRSYAVREVKAMARRDLAGTSAGAVRVLERSGEVRTLSGGAARVWQSLTSRATEEGRRPGGAVAGVTAVSVGQQTFAVKAGGVTALVQRPARAEQAPVTTDRASSRADRVMPAWLRELLSGAVRGHYWVDPSAGPVNRPAVSSADWVAVAMEQARAARDRARVELSGEIDPPTPVRFAQRPADVLSSSAMIDASVVIVAADPGSSSVVVSQPRPAAQYRLSEQGESAPLPIGRTAALPATTLRALYTALERTAAYEGRQLRGATVSVEEPLLPGGTGPVAVSQLELDTVPRQAPTLPASRTSIAATPGLTPEVRNVGRQTPHGLFALPFEHDGTLRIGRELEVVMARAFEGAAMAPIAVPATLDTLVRISGTPERVRIEVPDLRRARPRVEARAGVMGAGAVDLSALGELEWSTLAARASAPRTGVASRTPVGRARSTDDRHGTAPEREPLAWDESVAPQMDFAAPRSAHPGVLAGAGATALGAMAPAAGYFGAGDAFGWSSTSDVGGWPSAGTTPPLYVEPALATAALPLAEINFRRTPLEVGTETSEPVFAQSSGPGDDDQGTLNFDIPLPLHAQMSGKTLPVFARTRAAGPIGQAHAASAFPAPTSTPASPASASPMPAGTSASGSSPSGPVAKSMPALRRTPRDVSSAGARQVLVERPAIESGAESGGSFTGGSPASSRVPSANSPAGRSGSGSASAARAATPSTRAGNVGSVSVGAPVHASGTDASGAATAIPASGSSAAPASTPAGHSRFDGFLADSVPTGPTGARVRPAALGARAFTAESHSLSTLTMGHPSFEAVHVLQQSGAPVRPRRRGPTPLRFRYPTSARWWGEGTRTAGKAGYAGRLAASGAVVAAPAQANVGSGRVESEVVSPSRVSRTPTVGGRGAVAGSSMAAAFARGDGAGEATFVEGPSFAGDRPPVSDRETAYVVLNSDGHAQVMNARAASQVTRAKAHGAPVDMAVVAAVPPAAPTLEQMAVPGHDRPHAKAKKDQPKAGAAARTDATSLQGTVDSLAQRIYHRLRRRLEADRERFGG